MGFVKYDRKPGFVDRKIVVHSEIEPVTFLSKSLRSSNPGIPVVVINII